MERKGCSPGSVEARPSSLGPDLVGTGWCSGWGRPGEAEDENKADVSSLVEQEELVFRQIGVKDDEYIVCDTMLLESTSVKDSLRLINVLYEATWRWVLRCYPSFTIVNIVT